MTSHEKEQLLTTTIQIDSSDIYRTKNIDGLIKYRLKEQLEGLCGKYGYVIKNSISIIKRSIGKAVTYNNESKIEFNLTLKMKIILPCNSEVFNCKIDSITKMGIIAYMKMEDEKLNNINESPILFIIPQEYIEDDISLFTKDQIISIEVIEKRIKYRTKQIQVVGKISK
tara:strand:- start:798 stop:1307 length:510 start_codon:yes stop_codon:yes gene_type:complete